MTNFSHQGLMVFLVVVIAALGLSDGTKDVRAAKTSDATNQGRICVLVDSGRHMFGETREQIVDRLGKPKKAAVKKLKSRHDPKSENEFHRLVYPDVYIELLRVTSSGRDLKQEIRITSGRHDVKWGLKVGVPITAVKKKLGSPALSKESVWIYKCEEGYEDSVEFHFDQSAVVMEIRWNYWID